VEGGWARPVVHWGIVALDPQRQAEFYSKLCNWEIGAGPIMQIPAGLGGPEPGPEGHIRQGDRAGVALYVQVRDLRSSLALAVELGGRIYRRRAIRHPRRSHTGRHRRSRRQPAGTRAAVVRRGTRTGRCRGPWERVRVNPAWNSVWSVGSSDRLRTGIRRWPLQRAAFAGRRRLPVRSARSR
jgi:predicted enzyme related to lactoylglutathione lyase